MSASGSALLLGVRGRQGEKRVCPWASDSDCLHEEPSASPHRKQPGQTRLLASLNPQSPSKRSLASLGSTCVSQDMVQCHHSAHMSSCLISIISKPRGPQEQNSLQGRAGLSKGQKCSVAPEDPAGTL